MKYLLILIFIVSCTTNNLKGKNNTPITYSPDIDPNNYSYKDEEKMNRFVFQDEKTKLYGYKDRTRKIIIPPSFTMAFPFNSLGTSSVLIDKKWFRIDTQGKSLMEAFFFDNGPDYYVSGLARFIENGRIGFSNLKGEKVIPISEKYDWASPFSFGGSVAIVCKGCKEVPVNAQNDESGCNHTFLKGGLWGAIDKSGKIVVPLQFDGHSFNKELQTYFIKEKSCYLLLKNQDQEDFFLSPTECKTT